MLSCKECGVKPEILQSNDPYFHERKTAYIIQCPKCGKSTMVHKNPFDALSEWDARNAIKKHNNQAGE